MKPEWCPQEVWESAGDTIGGWTIDDGTNNQFWACQSSVAKALLEAHQRGRREGMEEVAVWHDGQAGAARGLCPVSETTHYFSSESIRRGLNSTRS